MKESYSKNMDVNDASKSKARDHISPSHERTSVTPPFRHPSEMVMDSLRRFLRYNGPTPENNIYSDNLTAGISRYCSLPANQIHIVPDTAHAINEIIKTFAKSDDSILVCRPADDDIFSTDFPENINIQYHEPPTPFTTDPEGIVDAVTGTTRLIYLANPNLCTGTIYGIDEIETIIDRTTDIKIILDETYFEYYGTSLAGLISQYGNIIVLRSFSAAFGLVDLPCGYILASAENIAAIKRTNPNSQVSPLSMVAASAVLGDYEYLKKHISTVRENMTYLSTRLRGMGLPVRTTPTDFILADVAEPAQLIARLHEAGIEARSLSNNARLQNYIAIRIIDDAHSAETIDILRSMPDSLYVKKQTGKKLVLHRTAEYKQSDVDTGKKIDE
jgi:histidinol-phosphate aminotransferase